MPGPIACAQEYFWLLTLGSSPLLALIGGLLALLAALLGWDLVSSNDGGAQSQAQSQGGGPTAPPMDTRVVGGREAIDELIRRGARTVNIGGQTYVVAPQNGWPSGVHGGGYGTATPDGTLIDPQTGRPYQVIAPDDAAIEIDWPHPDTEPQKDWFDGPNQAANLAQAGFPTITIGSTTYAVPPENVPENIGGTAYATRWVRDPDTGELHQVVDPDKPAYVEQWLQSGGQPPSAGSTAAGPVAEAPPEAPPPPSEQPPVPPPEEPAVQPPQPPTEEPPVQPPVEQIVEPPPPAEPPPVEQIVEPPAPPAEEPPVPSEPPPVQPVEPPEEYRPPGTETLEQIVDTTKRVQESGEKAKEFVEQLPISDEEKDGILKQLDDGLSKVKQVQETAEKADEYITVLDDNLRETEGKGYPEGAREFLAWWRVTSKGAGEAAESFGEGQIAPLPEPVQKAIKEAVPIAEFMDELGKLPTSAARQVRGGAQGEAQRAEDQASPPQGREADLALSEFDPNTFEEDARRAVAEQEARARQAQQGQEGFDSQAGGADEP